MDRAGAGIPPLRKKCGAETRTAAPADARCFSRFLAAPGIERPFDETRIPPVPPSVTSVQDIEHLPSAVQFHREAMLSNRRKRKGDCAVGHARGEALLLVNSEQPKHGRFSLVPK